MEENLCVRECARELHSHVKKMLWFIIDVPYLQVITGNKLLFLFLWKIGWFCWFCVLLYHGSVVLWRLKRPCRLFPATILVLWHFLTFPVFPFRGEEHSVNYGTGARDHPYVKMLWLGAQLTTWTRSDLGGSKTIHHLEPLLWCCCSANKWEDGQGREENKGIVVGLTQVHLRLNKSLVPGRTP